MPTRGSWSGKLRVRATLAIGATHPGQGDKRIISVIPERSVTTPASREGARSEERHSGAEITCSFVSSGQPGMPPRDHSKKGPLMGIAVQASWLLQESGRLFPVMNDVSNALL